MRGDRPRPEASRDPARTDPPPTGPPVANGSHLPARLGRGLPRWDRVVRALLLLLPLGVVANLSLLLVTTDRALLGRIRELPRAPLAAAVLLTLLPWVANAVRLHLWTLLFGLPLSFAASLRVVLGSLLGAAVTPTATGRGLFKWGLLVRDGVPAGTAATLCALEAAEDLVFFAISVPLALVLTAAWNIDVLRAVAADAGSNLLLVTFASLGVLGLFAGLTRSALRGRFGRGARRWSLRLVARIRRRMRRGWRDAGEALQLARHQGRGRFCVNVALSAVQWGARYSVITAVALFLGVEVRPVLFWLLQWVLFTVLIFVPTPGAAGAAETGLFLLYAPLIPEALLGVTTAAWRLLTFYAPVLAAALLFPWLRSARHAPDGPPRPP